jgi:polysaccharide pyruvyl transferase WcaK-like protein
MTNQPKKIGILTYTSNFNYGTFFQAYATLSAVRRHFPNSDVEMVNYNSQSKSQQVGYNKLNLARRHIYPPYLIKHLSKQSRYRATERRLLQMNAAEAMITDSYLESAEYISEQRYDLLVVGSDTVLNFYDWNLRLQELPIYWLPQSLPSKKVMISSSIGTDLNIDSLDQATQQALRDSIEGFSMLGVRDEITRDFIHDLTPQASDRLDIIPDPTFSYAIDGTHSEAYLKRKGVSPDVPIIGLDLPTRLIGVEDAVKHLKSKGYAVASWRGVSKVADYDFSDMGPLEWSGIFKRFDITLTNRFHASIFSLKNSTPVITMDYKTNRISRSKQSKASMLMDSFGLKDTNYKNVADITDSAWVLSAMQAALDEPRIKELQSSISRKNREYNSYLGKITSLFST